MVDKKKSTTSKKNVAKGKAAERAVVNVLVAALEPVYSSSGRPMPEIRRNLNQSQSGGSDIDGLPWFDIEVKNVSNLNNADRDRHWEQVLRAVGESDRIPVVWWWGTGTGRNQSQVKFRAQTLFSRHDFIDLDVTVSSAEFLRWLQFYVWWRINHV